MSAEADTDLFGLPINKRPYKSPPDYAHPAKPGTGPAGETCKTCSHCVRTRCRRNYYKCFLIKKNWTNAIGTDLRLKDQACMFFKKKDVKL